MVTVEQIRSYVGASANDDPYIADILQQSSALVYRHVGSSITTIDSGILDRAILECASELFHRRQAPNGIAQFGTPDGSVVRVARDPMVGAYPILAPFIRGGIG